MSFPRASNKDLEHMLALKNVVMRGNTEEINEAFGSTDPAFKTPRIPDKYPITYFWLCKKSDNSECKEYYWVFWTRGEIRPFKRGPILAEDPIVHIQKRPEFHRDLVDSLWASGKDYERHEYEMIVEDYDGEMCIEMFEVNPYFQNFHGLLLKENNILNWRERVFQIMARTRTEYYQERFRVTRNDHYLKMAVFWRQLDWKVLSTEHFAVMTMCLFKQVNLGFVDALLRAHYS